MIALAAAVAVGGWIWLRPRGNEGATGSAAPAAVVEKAKPLTEAQQLVAKAREIFEEGDEVNRETYVLAEELLIKAEKLDPTEASAWALHAIISRWYRGLGFDMSAQRLDALRMQAERAAKLAPGTLDAELATIAMRSSQDAASAQEALVELARNYPGNSRVASALGMPMRGLAQDRTILDALQRSHAADPENMRVKAAIVNAMYQLGHIAEAEALVGRWLADRPNARIRLFDVHFKMWWRGDLAGADAAIERWPAWLHVEDRGVQAAGLVWHWKRDGERLLRAVSRFPRDYVRISLFTGPRAVLRAWAFELLARPEQAKAEWQEVGRLADRELQEFSGDAKARFWKAWALARLGQKEEAEALLRLLEEDPAELQALNLATGGLTGLQIQLGQYDRAFAALDAGRRREEPISRWITKAQLALSPIFDPLRKDPRFAELLRTAPGPELKSDGMVAVTGVDKAAPMPNEKSLVVLPFENLSPDPEMAFFTEGMHQEVIAVLQRTLPELKVVSRPTALAFKDAKLSIADFAQKIGVANVITGSVRRVGDRLRVQLELRRARDEALLWASPKPDRSLKDQFDIQSEVAEEVARILQIRERRGTWAGAQFMTNNREAYDRYLKIRQAMDADYGRVHGAMSTIQELEQILQLDPGFLPAASLLSTCYARAYQSSTDSVERVRFAGEAKRWADSASRLAPGGAGDDALANYYYRVEINYPRALEFAHNVIQALPNDATGHNRAGLVLMGLGREAEAATAFRRAVELDPTDSVFWANLASSLSRLRRPSETEAAIERQVAVNPSGSRRLIQYARYRLTGALPEEPMAAGADWLRRARRFPELLAMAERELALPGITELGRLRWLGVQSDALHWLRRSDEAKAVARVELSLAERIRPADSNEVRRVAERRAWALARLGNADEALGVGRRLVESISVAERFSDRQDAEVNLAELFAYLNRPRECLELLAKLLRVPSGLTVPMLKVDPAWDNVREEPAFEALLADPKNNAPL
jgi:TolB-like protein/predicted Zn-dependent protease